MHTRSRPLSLPLLFLLSVLLASPLVAQHQSQWILLEDRTYHAGDFEPFRIFLARGRKYRAEFSDTTVILQMRSFDGKSLPFARLIGDGPGSTGETDYEISPNSDGVIEFRAVDGVRGTATRFRLWQLPDAYVDTPDTPSGDAPLEVGVELRAGHHYPYLTEDFTYAYAGDVVDGCLALRGGSGLFARMSGCVLGASHMGGGYGSSLSFAFVEPHVRVVGRALHAGTAPSAGAVVRASYFTGTSDSTAKNPPITQRVSLGAGIYVALDHRGRPRGGYRLELEVLVDQVGGSTETIVTPTTPRPGPAHAVAITLGGGWFL